MMTTVVLKTDTFGRVLQIDDGSRIRVRRDTRNAPHWARWLARRLARREARALAALTDIEGTPALLASYPWGLEREWMEGRPMHLARPRDAAYYRHAFRLLRRMHRAGIAHNDLAKEPNWLVDDRGRPAIVDFQLALLSPRRGPLFRLAAREDIRHFLKHKRTYRPECLTAREKQMLASPAWTSRIWMASGKKIYLFVTRRLLGWADREGAGDRRHAQADDAGGRAGIIPASSPPGPGENMGYANRHNLVDPDKAGQARRWGIRVTLPPSDPFNKLVGADWEKFHWFPSERERDQALDRMRTRHGYYRIGDEVSLNFEKVER